MAFAGSAKTKFNIYKVHKMTTIDSNNIDYVNEHEIDGIYDTIIMHNDECDSNKQLRGISFNSLCKAIAKKLVDDGIWSGKDDNT